MEILSGEESFKKNELSNDDGDGNGNGNEKAEKQKV